MTGRAARVAAIGRATADAWGEVDLVPAVATQEGLLAELPRPAGRVLFAGAEGARPLLAQELEADVVVLYQTRALSPRIEGDLAVIASPSAARVLAEINPCDSRRLDRARDDGSRAGRRAARPPRGRVAGRGEPRPRCRGIASGRGHLVPVRFRARRRLRRCLPRRDREDRSRGAGDRHHARDRAAGRAAGRAGARRHAAVRPRGYSSRGRRPWGRERPAGDRRP